MPRKPKAPDPLPAQRRSRNSGSVGTRASDGRAFAILPKDLDGKRRPVYGFGKGRPFTSETEAARWLDAEVARRRDPSPKAAHRAELLARYLARWYALYSPGWPPRTASTYRRALLRWKSLGDVPLGELTREHIQAGIAALQTATWQYHKKDGTPVGEPRPYSARTIACARTVLGIALELLVPDILAFNPVRRTRLGKAQEPKPLVWDGDQADRFLVSAEARAPILALAFRLVVRRALRRGEVLALRRDDIDWRRRMLRIDETAGEHVGETGDTKGRRAREIPLSHDLSERLRAHLAGQGMTTWVFDHDGKPYSASTLGYYARVIAIAAGLPPIGLKDMRATCATLWLDEGIALARVSRLLGHANVAVTARFYDRILEQRRGRIERVADELDAALDRATETARAEAPRALSEGAE